MTARHAEPADRVALEVELDQHHRFLADHPPVVTRLDRDDLRRAVLHDAAVRVLDVNLTARQEADMRVHAVVGVHDGLHVGRPAEPRRVDHPLHARAARAADVEPDVPELAALGPLHGAMQWVHRLLAACGRASTLRREGLLAGLPGGLLLRHAADASTFWTVRDADARARRTRCRGHAARSRDRAVWPDSSTPFGRAEVHPCYKGRAGKARSHVERSSGP